MLKGMMLKEILTGPDRLPDYTNYQLSALVVLRVLIGWHFLYEGVAKIFNPYWTSAGYLAESKWLFSDLFLAMVANPTILSIIDFLNMWGLVAIGLGLIVGCLTRAAGIAGIFLLFLYYIANPPFIGYRYTLPTEGSYLIVNKNLVELCALAVLTVFPTGTIIGFDRILFRKK